MTLEEATRIGLEVEARKGAEERASDARRREVARKQREGADEFYRDMIRRKREAGVGWRL